MRVLRNLIWVAAAVSIGLGLGYLPLFETPVGSLHGRLVARDSGHPVATEVALSGEQHFRTRSDEDGVFSFDEVPAGHYVLSAETPGHELKHRAVLVQEGKRERITFEMVRRLPWVQLIIHEGVLYPGEPTSIAVRGLMLYPAYHLAVYRVNGFRSVTASDARHHPKALQAALAAGEVTRVSEREVTPGEIDWEGAFYDRTDLGDLPVGRYLVVAEGKETSSSAEWLTISRLGILVKTDPQRAIAYVTDLKSGDPVEGARVTAGRSAAVTDANGLARLRPLGGSGGRQEYTAQLGEDSVSVSCWRHGGGGGYRLLSFTDRPIYRPGDEVHFKGVLRKRTGSTYQLPGRITVQLSVKDPDGTEVYEADLRTNEQGSFADSFGLPAEGKTGHYTVTSRIGNFRESTWVKVASYLKPELELSARPERVNYIRGEQAIVDIQATYYFGAPAADLGVRWTLTRDTYYGGRGYYGGWEYEDEYYYGGGELMAEGEGRTDEAGRLRLALPTRFLVGDQESEDNPYFDHRLTLRVWSTSDVGGSAEASTTYLVTRGDFALRVRPSCYVLAPNEPAGLKVEAEDFEGSPVADQDLSLALVREIRPEDRGEVKRFTVTTWTACTGADGVAETTVTVPKAGAFLLEVTAVDLDGRTIAARQHLWAASGEDWDFRGWRREPGLSIVADREEYGPRDRVKLLVMADHAGPGLFCLEGERLHEVRPLRFREGANIIEFDLTPAYLPNVEVWVGQVHDKRVHRASETISISRDMHRLAVNVEPGRQEYEPGKLASCTLQVTDLDGRPARAELAVGVVDEAIYALASDRVQDPADYFYHHRHNRVATAFAPHSFYWGGGDKAPPTVEVRRRFRDTAFWAPYVLTDANGRAEVEFTLPDNLTSWRVTARAVSADTRGGAGRANFQVSKPLMVRLDLPRFATEKDRFRVSAYVHNETDSERSVSLGSWAQGLQLESRDEELEVGARRVVRRDWWATVTSPEDVVIGASAVSGQLQDAVEHVLPVNPYTKTQFDAWSGQTEEAAEIVLPVRQDSVLNRTRLTVAVSPSIAGSLFSSLDYLVHYPYGCVEQTVSSFLPNLHVQQLLAARGMYDSDLEAEARRNVIAGIALLKKKERSEGGWGWGRWGDLDIWMTSYVLLALTDAKEAGYSVVIDSRARYALEWAIRSEREHYPDDLAFAGYVLARLGSDLAQSTIARALEHKKLSGRGRALCALAYYELGFPPQAEELVVEIWRTAKQEGEWRNWTGLQDVESEWWDGGANIEATAWSLKAVLRSDPKDPRAMSVAQWLLHARNGDRWVSTRDTGIALSALVDYLRVYDEPNPDYTAVVRVNGEQTVRNRFSPELKTWREVEAEVPADLLQTGANVVSFNLDEGAGRLYYRANLRQQVRMEEDEETARGDIFHIRREYFKLGRAKSGDSLAYGPASKPGETFANGERVLVRLTFTSSQRLRYVLIEDPLPAGLEPSARGDVGFMDWRSWWVDNDVRDDKVNFYLDWLPAGERVIEYVVTARTPGQFKALPTNGFAMYQPAVNALADQARLEVKP